VHRRRLAHLDGLRGLAALFVVLHHVWLTVWPLEYGRAPSGWARATDVFAYGHFAVGVFIVLSGYCLARPDALADGVRGFFRRRARRILPPYYAALGLSLLLATTVVSAHTGTHWDISVPVTRTGFLANAFLVQDVLAQGQVNHVFWSIAVECQIYLLFPLLLLVLLRRGVAPAIGLGASLAAVLCVVVALVPTVGSVALSGLTPQYLFLFVLGMAAAHVRAASVPWSAVACIAAATLVAIVAALGRARAFAAFPWLDPIVGVATASLLVALARERPSRARTLLSARHVAGLGAMAYSVYLIHAPLVQIAWQAGIQPFELRGVGAFGLLLLLAVPFVLGCSAAFFRVCERPFLRAQPPGPAPRALPIPALTAAMITPANVTMPSARTNVSPKNR
jgi:peptidoglycan/LPS O-acetylase OafA/YrhL